MNSVVIPRTEEQREYVRALDLPSVIVPDRAVDAQSLISLADVVVSAGGTMNREAAALGVPVYTTYGGRLGGVDEELIREGRLKPLTDPRALELSKRDRRLRRAVSAAIPRSCSGSCSAPGTKPPSPSIRRLRARREPRRRSARASTGPTPGTDAELGQVTRTPARDLRERGVVEDDVRGQIVRGRALEPPALQRRVERIVGLALARLPGGAAAMPSSARNRLGLPLHDSAR